MYFRNIIARREHIADNSNDIIDVLLVTHKSQQEINQIQPLWQSKTNILIICHRIKNPHTIMLNIHTPILHNKSLRQSNE